MNTPYGPEAHLAGWKAVEPPSSVPGNTWVTAPWSTALSSSSKPLFRIQYSGFVDLNIDGGTHLATGHLGYRGLCIRKENRNSWGPSEPTQKMRE